MNRRTGLFLFLSSALTAGCLPPLPPEVMTCEEADDCPESGSTSSGDDGTPTTSDGVQTVTGDDAITASSSTTADDETGTPGTTGEPAEPPVIIDGVVIPDYIDDNGVLVVEASTTNAEGVHLLLDTGEQIELMQVGPGAFVGQIKVFSAVDNNGKHTAVLTPYREQLVGESVEVDYVIALPKEGNEIGPEIGGPGGDVVAIAVLPDGQPVELGTYQDMGEPRCYLQLREKHGNPVEFVDLLPPANCRAIDLKIDRDTGRLHVLVEREKGDDNVWWAGEISAWGKGPKNIGTGAPGDTAFALAARPDVVAVCGSRVVLTPDKLDAFAVLLRPGVKDDEREFDYRPVTDPTEHQFTETAHDCAFAADKLVLVGDANGDHDGEKFKFRDRLVLIEADVTGAEDPVWTVAGIERGVQTRALALDLDEQGRYHLAGDRCDDTCEPDGALWIYEPGGDLVNDNPLGPLGSPFFGPHDIAWSPAGYAVIALGEMQGQSPVFKVQAFAPGVPEPVWTFRDSGKQGLALAVAVGWYGEVYAGGLDTFKRIGG